MNATDFPDHIQSNFTEVDFYESLKNNMSLNNSEIAHFDMSMYIYVWVSLVNAVIFLIGIFGNIMVILVVINVRDMRTHMNYCLLNLSVADLLVLLVCQPSALLEFYAKDRWYLGETMCKLIKQLENTVVHASMLTILNITFERFTAICYPLKKKSYTCVGKTVAKNIAFIWIFAYLSTLPFMIMTRQQDAIFYDGSPCKLCRTQLLETWHHVYSVSVFIIFYVLILFVLIIMYSRIIKCLVRDAALILPKQDPRSLATLKTRKQVVRMLIAIIVLFFITMFPIRILTLWLVYSPDGSVAGLGLDGYVNLLSFARVMMYINSAGNPIIYSLTSTKFKRAFARVLVRRKRRLSFSRSQRTQYQGTELQRKLTTKCFIGTDNHNQGGNVCIEIRFQSV